MSVDVMARRAGGVLLHLSSLPSPGGIGTMGQAARDFVDFLAQAGQSYGQLLPVCPTGYGNSPYQSPSSFAGNPYFIDLDMLIADGLLTPDRKFKSAALEMKAVYGGKTSSEMTEVEIESAQNETAEESDADEIVEDKNTTIEEVIVPKTKKSGKISKKQQT
mgnify:CR=1 FL=1